MTPEREVLEQIADGSLPLHVIAMLFPNLEHCKRALGAMIEDRQVVLIDPMGRQSPVWRYRELRDQADTWMEASGFRLEITALGGTLLS